MPENISGRRALKGRLGNIIGDRRVPWRSAMGDVRAQLGRPMSPARLAQRHAVQEKRIAELTRKVSAARTAWYDNPATRKQFPAQGTPAFQKLSIEDRALAIALKARGGEETIIRNLLLEEQKMRSAALSERLRKNRGQ